MFQFKLSLQDEPVCRTDCQCVIIKLFSCLVGLHVQCETGINKVLPWNFFVLKIEWACNKSSLKTNVSVQLFNNFNTKGQSDSYMPSPPKMTVGVWTGLCWKWKWIQASLNKVHVAMNEYEKYFVITCLTKLSTSSWILSLFPVKHNSIMLTSLPPFIVLYSLYMVMILCLWLYKLNSSSEW